MIRLTRSYVPEFYKAIIHDQKTVIPADAYMDVAMRRPDGRAPTVGALGDAGAIAEAGILKQL